MQTKEIWGRKEEKKINNHDNLADLDSWILTCHSPFSICIVSCRYYDSMSSSSSLRCRGRCHHEFCIWFFNLIFNHTRNIFDFLALVLFYFDPQHIPVSSLSLPLSASHLITTQFRKVYPWTLLTSVNDLHVAPFILDYGTLRHTTGYGNTASARSIILNSEPVALWYWILNTFQTRFIDRQTRSRHFLLAGDLQPGWPW